MNLFGKFHIPGFRRLDAHPDVHIDRVYIETIAKEILIGSAEAYGSSDARGVFIPGYLAQGRGTNHYEDALVKRFKYLGGKMPSARFLKELGELTKILKTNKGG